MKNVRIWFTKEKECRFISHLDLNRCMLRAVRRAQLPIWYTEGFNPHPFITFPLPLSLGIDGKRECMDIRIVDDNYDINNIPKCMNIYLPEGISVFDATYPVLDPKHICFAEYSAELESDDIDSCRLKEGIEDICKSYSEIIIEKKSKAGMKTIDVLPYVKSFAYDDSGMCKFKVILPAGNIKNIGLPLIIKGLEKYLNIEINYRIIKLNMFTEDMKPFK